MKSFATEAQLQSDHCNRASVVKRSSLFLFQPHTSETTSFATEFLLDPIICLSCTPDTTSFATEAVAVGLLQQNLCCKGIQSIYFFQSSASKTMIFATKT